jgi:hypothetical protein
MTRPPSFTRRVEQVMKDLLAVPQGRHRPDTMPADGDPLPVGLAARLGVLMASKADPSVLTGGLSRGTPEEQAARKQLLSESAARTLGFDITAPLSLPVSCGRRLHAIALEEDGSVVAVAHPGVDVVSERVAASLGGQLSTCVREVIAAGYGGPVSCTEHGPRSEPVGAGELLSFVATCRSWLSRGFTLGECALAVDRGLTHGQVQAHLDAGLDLIAAAEWVFLPAAEAVRWRAIEFGPGDVKTWQSQGRSLRDAEEAARNSGGGRWLARWARVAGRSVQSEALAAWAAMGLPVGIWGDVASRGVRAEDALTWLAEGFSSVEILRYAHLRIEISEALRWRAEGFTGFVAAGCLGVGMTLADACALRGLPTREVQDAWRRHRSVDDVRAEVEALIADEPRPRVSAG